MSKRDNKLKLWNDDCLKQIKNAKGKVNKNVEADVEQFQRNTLPNIPQNFGEFLYTALGDRVTGQRNSVLNQTFFDETEKGQKIKEAAEKAGQTIEKYLVENQNPSVDTYRNRYNTNTNVQLYITAGRKFGISYLTGNGSRTHTMYFGAGECFSYLTQEHVNCVKNKLKRECTQDFMDFKNDFIHNLNGLRDCLIEVNQDVKLAVVSNITKSPKINSNAGSYNDEAQQRYVILDEIINTKVTHIIASVQHLNVWDKKTSVTTYDVRADTANHPSYVSFIFLNINDETKQIKIIGNFDIGMEDSTHSLQDADKFEKRSVDIHIDDIQNFFRLNQNPAIANSEYKNYKVVDSDGILLDMTVLLKNPTVHKEIKKRIKFYNDMSVKLQELKHNHASLYFIHADM